MYKQKHVLAASALFLMLLALTVPAANGGKPSEYDAIVSHLKSKYQAKKVKIPFMWLARFAVGVVRPAGVKSFSITMFDHLQVARETLDAEMQNALRQTFGPEWSPVFRVRSRTGQQAYMYMREDGENVRLTLVTIEKDQAAIIRATFSPEKLVEFTNDPKVFGVHLDDGDKKQDAPKTNEEPAPQAKPAQ